MQTSSLNSASAPRRSLSGLAAFLLFGCLANSAWSQTKWDLASAYPADQLPHREHRRSSPGDVEKATGGKPSRSRCIPTRRCSRHPKSSAPCKAARRRPVRSCWPTTKTRARSSALDGVPFLATSYKNAKSLYDATEAGALALPRQAGHRCCCTRCRGRPRACTAKKEVGLHGRHARASSGAPTRPATAKMGELIGRAIGAPMQAAELSAGHGHRRGGSVHDLQHHGRGQPRSTSTSRTSMTLQAWLPEERGAGQRQGLPVAGQGAAGSGAQGRGGRRGARLETEPGEERRGQEDAWPTRA